MADIPEARPASTVVLLRDIPGGMETLLLKRNRSLVMAGGLWVFPGGALDPEDLDAAGGELVAASRVAAAREALEESGLQPQLDEMVLLSHWTTPVGEPKRFSTWIHAAPLAAEERVVIDGEEIHDSLWISLRAAVSRHELGELGMLPPTYITLRRLSRYGSVAEMVKKERDSPVPEVFPRFGHGEGDVVLMFRGDAGYDSGDARIPGSRHRVRLCDNHWEYEHCDVPEEYPPLVVAA